METEANHVLIKAQLIYFFHQLRLEYFGRKKQIHLFFKASVLSALTQAQWTLFNTPFSLQHVLSEHYPASAAVPT